jgi:hypothetical protein
MSTTVLPTSPPQNISSLTLYKFKTDIMAQDDPDSCDSDTVESQDGADCYHSDDYDSDEWSIDDQVAHYKMSEAGKPIWYRMISCSS